MNRAPVDLTDPGQVRDILREARAVVMDRGADIVERCVESARSDETHRYGRIVAALAGLEEAPMAAAVAVGRYKVLHEFAAERVRQDAKWGEQNHPSVPYMGLGSVSESGGVRLLPLVEVLPIPTAEFCRALVELASRCGAVTFAAIALEEFAEAADVGDDDKACRAELVQLGAVVAAWVEAIDRRLAAGGGSARVKL